jgi:hypothetical protein
MKIRKYEEAGEFLSKAESLLFENEAANSLPLGILYRFVKEMPSTADEKPFFALSEKESEPLIGWT